MRFLPDSVVPLVLKLLFFFVEGWPKLEDCNYTESMLTRSLLDPFSKCWNPFDVDIFCLLPFFSPWYLSLGSSGEREKNNIARDFYFEKFVLTVSWVYWPILKRSFTIDVVKWTEYGFIKQFEGRVPCRVVDSAFPASCELVSMCSLLPMQSFPTQCVA